MRLDRLFAFVVRDESGSEAVLRGIGPLGITPLMATSRGALETVRQAAEEAADEMRLPMFVAEFVRVENNGN